MDEERIVNDGINETAEVAEGNGVDIVELAKKIGPVGAGLVGTVGLGFLVKKALGHFGYELRSPIAKKQVYEEVTQEYFEETEAE